MSDFEKKVKKLKELDDRITAEEKNGCIYLSGEVDDWNTVVKAGRIAVDKKYIGVVNDVKLKGFVQKQYVPPITDNALDGLSPDVLIIGAGLVGAATARELSKYNLDVLVVEKGADVAAGQSSRNGGAVHVGINYSPSETKCTPTLRATLTSRLKGSVIFCSSRKSGSNFFPAFLCLTPSG